MATTQSDSDDDVPLGSLTKAGGVVSPKKEANGGASVTVKPDPSPSAKKGAAAKTPTAKAKAAAAAAAAATAPPTAAGGSSSTSAGVPASNPSRATGSAVAGDDDGDGKPAEFYSKPGQRYPTPSPVRWWCAWRHAIATGVFSHFFFELVLRSFSAAVSLQPSVCAALAAVRVDGHAVMVVACRGCIVGGD